MSQNKNSPDFYNIRKTTAVDQLRSTPCCFYPLRAAWGTTARIVTAERVRFVWCATDTKKEQAEVGGKSGLVYGPYPTLEIATT